jgi:phosphoglycerol transferase MdoB-like AlkP superfamily enzyme
VKWKSALKLLKPVFLFLIFWVIQFHFQRLVFLTVHFSKLADAKFLELIRIFFESFRLDIATAALLSAFPLLFWLFWCYIKSNASKMIFLSVMIIELIIISLIHSGEVNVYHEWNHKLTSRVFMHLSNPDEVFRTAEWTSQLLFFFIFCIEIIFGILSLRWFKFNSVDLERKWIFLPTGLFYLICFLVLARGGLQQIPINIDSAYFSKNSRVNDLSVNSTYYFGNSYLLFKRNDLENHLPNIKPAIAKLITDSLYSFDRNHNNYVLQDSKPNVVFIILESWSASVIGCMSQTKGLTPNFDNLASQGYLFQNIYATNTTSEIGNTSIFSGYPALPEIAISLEPEKNRKLLSINQVLKKDGYSSHYLFSGDLKYGNIQGYLTQHDFDELADEKNFPSHLTKGKLNYFDENLFDIFLKKINKTKSPFMHCAFTGSTHSPFDYPKRKGWQKWKGKEEAYMNSVFYADQALGQFFEKAKKEAWYENTIFVMVADHGHHSHTILNPNQSLFFRIPFLIFGEPLKKEFRGSQSNLIGSQSDIAATLLHQLRKSNVGFKFSKDLLSPNVKSFAFHATIRGYGFVSPKGSFIYNLDAKRNLENKFSKVEFPLEKNKSDALFLSYYLHFKSL